MSYDYISHPGRRSDHAGRQPEDPDPHPEGPDRRHLTATSPQRSSRSRRRIGLSGPLTQATAHSARSSVPRRA